jgi:hypothetical protein
MAATSTQCSLETLACRPVAFLAPGLVLLEGILRRLLTDLYGPIQRIFNADLSIFASERWTGFLV